jgi:hypothetical protein
MHSVRDCDPDRDNYASEKEYGTRGREEDGSKGVECAEERWIWWGEACSATRRVVVLIGRDVDKGIYRRRG